MHTFMTGCTDRPRCMHPHEHTCMHGDTHIHGAYMYRHISAVNVCWHHNCTCVQVCSLHSHTCNECMRDITYTCMCIYMYVCVYMHGAHTYMHLCAYIQCGYTSCLLLTSACVCTWFTPVLVRACPLYLHTCARVCLSEA